MLVCSVAPAGMANAVRAAGGVPSWTSRKLAEMAELALPLPTARTLSGSPVAGSAHTSTWLMVETGSAGTIRNPAALRPATRADGSRLASAGVAWLSSRRASCGGSRSASVGSRTSGVTGCSVKVAVLDS